MLKRQLILLKFTKFIIDNLNIQRDNQFAKPILQKQN